MFFLETLTRGTVPATLRRFGRNWEVGVEMSFEALPVFDVASVPSFYGESWMDELFSQESQK